MATLVSRFLTALQSVGSDIKALQQLCPSCLVNFNGAVSTQPFAGAITLPALPKYPQGVTGFTLPPNGKHQLHRGWIADGSQHD
jgi:hypothetical protein